MVYGTQITIVTGAFVNQLTSLGGGGHIVWIYTTATGDEHKSS